MKKLILIASLLIPYQNFSMNSSSTSNECFLHNNMIEVTSMFVITSIGFIWAAKEAYTNKQLKKQLEFSQKENKKLHSINQQFAQYYNQLNQSNYELYQRNQSYLETIHNQQNQNNILDQENKHLKSNFQARTNSNGKRVSFSMHNTQHLYDPCISQEV